MAHSARAVWEVRTASGADTNGGAFIKGASGTDYSQQASPQLALTDLVTDGTSTVTSATGSFTAAMVGNLCYITGGTASITPGWYEITAYNSATSITLDRSTGLTTGTGATCNVGGALATVRTALEDAAQSDATVYVTGSTTLTTAIQPSLNTGAVRVQLVGYGSTRGDRVLQTITTSTNSIALINLGSSNRYFTASNIAFTSTASTKTYIINGGTVTQYAQYTNCEMTGGTIGVYAGTNTAGRWNLMDCYVHDNTSHGFQHSGGEVSFHGCTFKSNGGNGINIQGATTVRLFRVLCVNNTLDGCYGATSHGRYVYVRQCTFANNGGDGLNVITDSSTGRGHFEQQDCIFAYNGGYGNNNGSTTLKGMYYHIRNNFYIGNTSGEYNTAYETNYDRNSTTLTADPFTDKSTGDYTLNNVSGGGAACRAAGWRNPSSANQSYHDAGALQHQDAGGGGSAANARALTYIGI